MRDIVITLLVFGSLPLILRNAYIGVLMWIWVSVMNPHRLSYGFAYSFPFAAVVAAVTIVALLITKEDKKLPMTPIVVTLIVFSLWMAITTMFGMFPDKALPMLQRVEKTMLMTLVVMMLIKSRKHIEHVIWALVLSLGYYGVKGGVFTIASGGHSIVWGPEGSYIEGNNELALALITIIPMMACLMLNATNKWVRRGLLLAMVLCGASALGSYSRGALLGIGAMVGFLWWKSPKKLAVGMAIALLLPIGMLNMPDKWTKRMETINTYQEDASAMGRINAWKFAVNLAMDRPFGGGYEVFTGKAFRIYAPNPEDIHAAHSIYFQAIGEHGWVGLLIYLTLAMLIWRRSSWVVREIKKRQRDDLKWAANIATMIQVSMIGFATGGAFLSLLYYDVPYYLTAVMVALGQLVEKALKEAPPAAQPTAAPAPKAQPPRWTPGPRSVYHRKS